MVLLPKGVLLVILSRIQSTLVNCTTSSQAKLSRVEFKEKNLNSAPADIFTVRKGTEDGEPPTWDVPFGFAC